MTGGWTHRLSVRAAARALGWARALAWAGAATVVAGAMLPERVTGQEIRGRITDSENGAPVGMAAVILLDAERTPVLSGAAGIDGFYTITTPVPGEFIMIVERLGYFDNETPLFAVDSGGVYGIDIEMRPEPFRLDPLEVTVENERLEDFLTLRMGVHPASVPGYRSIQGVRLVEAKLKAEDNTDLLRWLYIPISHGRQVCINSPGAGAPMPARSSWERVNQASEQADPNEQCGALYLDDILCRNEHIESIDMDRIAVVVTFHGAVHLYTREFEWRGTGKGGAC